MPEDTKHAQLVQKAKDAIDNVFSDRSVSREKTRDSLEEIADEINLILETLNG